MKERLARIWEAVWVYTVTLLVLGWVTVGWLLLPVLIGGGTEPVGPDNPGGPGSYGMYTGD